MALGTCQFRTKSNTAGVARMHNTRLWVMSLSIVPLVSAEHFSATFVDGLNRPLRDVSVTVYCSLSTNTEEKVLPDIHTGANGVAEGDFGDVSGACRETMRVSFEKKGYESLFQGGLHSRYVLRREFRTGDADALSELNGSALQDALRELLAGDFHPPQHFSNLVFYDEARLRPALRALAREPEVTVRARDLLALIGVPDDLRFILQLPNPAEANGLFPERWRYAVVTSMLDPGSEIEWLLLRDCAINKFDDRWVDAGAIQTLKLIASPRSRQLLEEAQAWNQFRAKTIAKALAHIDSGPAALVDADLEELAARLAGIVAVGAWKGNDKPRYNQAGDKALIDFHFRGGGDILVYTATFHNLGGAWRLRAVRETHQAFGL